jgi:hypothetical protein
MPHTLRLDPSGDWLDLRYQGVVSVAERMQAWSEAKPLLVESGVRRILIDLMQASAADDPVPEFSAFVARITREPILLQSRTAFVAPPVNYLNHRIEVLADARHYPFSRFTDRAAALEWLLGDAPPLGLEGALRSEDA